tara:strand:+ start:1475 stop:1666 length:192 start_codon:yes stop_codon:yes gene_type:complete
MSPEIIQVQQVHPCIINVTYFGYEGEYNVVEEFNTTSQCADKMDEYTAQGCFIYNPINNVSRK